MSHKGRVSHDPYAQRCRDNWALTVATAQQNPIAARKQLMKDNGDQAKVGAAMAKGEAPFDLAKAHKIFATFEDTALKAPGFVPGKFSGASDPG